ncbi:sulfotransferase family protein [Vibrio galatheae]|nr:sulfotransferase [Vibrio galatheae]
MSKSIFLVKIKDLFIRVAFRILTIPLVPINSYLLRKYGEYDEELSPIFIIGAPRTGSTILYQGLTNQFDVLYFNNLNTKFCNIPLIGFWLSEKFFEGKAHNCFDSKFGNTNGLNSPNESGEYWIRFLPKDRHFIDFSDINSIDVARIRRELTALCNMFGKPLIFKNLNAGQRMRLLHVMFPNARFIFIHRDPFYTAQSILESKRKQGINDNEYWSIKPANYDYLCGLKWYRQIPEQIFYLEKQILEDKSLFHKENFYDISYSSLSSKIIAELGCSLNLREKNSFETLNLKIKEIETLTLEEVDLLKESIGSLNW